ncbi:FumA C-terminus/TtdB family hydratase beta subunit [Methanimicrococcus blatticola]|uniref:Fumarase class I beta subunit n=1 Tax=Methanimicrococcus blatticola TaxID=91560 RepID=A0A484F4C2_9EURY|nr:FumA C-terminus/TtdB family hydratase beta subunit [Methanimicrococcus blatticola]MBZ3935570.1 fumarate hydratase C-terminal domain-containing protein [Methanimicrococcus blatticola]MCC2509212.1 FumA C-terminus/TtdB family hydratase beta subunit [Methanimicrococcus blatticola]TDQ69421.1 fumarase class I beta subunit [Methanimicrococcus blatticola]
MSKTHYLKTPLFETDISEINAGDVVYISGTIYTARDEAHLRILEYDEESKSLPFDLEGAAIYHCGPVMEKKEDGWKAVAAGPTTSDRMTKMTPAVLKNHGIRVLIGKGGMEGLAETMSRQKCIYLSYTGGCAALAVDMIQKVNGVAWEDLGMPEAVWELQVEKFGPLIAGIDTKGNDLFKDVKEKAIASFQKQFK